MLVAVAAAALAFAITPQSGALGAFGRIVDRSIGMWLLRRLTGRGDASSSPRAGVESPAPDEIAYRIGVPGAPEPTRPDRLVVTGSARASAGQVEPRRRLRRDPAAVLVGASVLVLIAAAVLPQLPRGEVLDAIDESRFPAMVTPPPGPDGSDTAVASPSPATSASPSATPSADPSASPAATVPSTPSATPAPTIARTPTPGPTAAPTSAATATPRPATPPPPTPRPTPPPTTAPTPTPPPPTPTPPPPVVTPSPTPPPPIAAVSCTVVGFTVSCTSAGSQNAVSYSWTFEAGPAATGSTAEHTYAAIGDYVVTLTVTNSVGQTDSQSTIARVSG